jgi:SAM-dependent methyltransferase
MDGTLREHWDEIYADVGPSQVSWYQPTATVSLQLIDGLELRGDEPVVDVGGGASTLVDALLARGHSDVTVLDLSQAALDAAGARLGRELDRRTHLVCQDVLTWTPPRRFGLWHDRAVFHFLVDPAAQAAYLKVLKAATDPGSHVVIGTFAADGPEYCSGLPVARYDADALGAALGTGFMIVDTAREEHITPRGAAQLFTWLSATRVS